MAWLVATSIATAVAACLIPILFFPSDTLRLLRRKNYQYEVTFGLYMLTPTEKVVLNSFFFLVGSVFIVALTFYFPRHLNEVYNRVIYYWSGHFLETASHPISSLTGRVASINHAIQNSLGGAHSLRLLNASQQVMSGAHDLIKGLTAAAVSEAASTLSAAAAAMDPELNTAAVSPVAVPTVAMAQPS